MWLSGCSSIGTLDPVIDEDEPRVEEITLSRFEPIQFSESELTCGNALRDFGIALLSEGISGMPSEGILIQSPISAALALTMLANGAEGETLAEIQNSLYYGCKIDEINELASKLIKNLGSTDTSVSTSLANSLWSNTPFSFDNRFKAKMKDIFNADTYETDFSQKSTRDAMDKWCANKTQNLINKISDCVDSRMKALILNATYFKAPWSKRFNTRSTVKDKFRGTDHTADVDMMNTRDKLRFHADDDFTMVEIPFGNGGYSMSVLLPEGGGPLAESCKALTPLKWNSLVKEAKETDVTLSLPKFKIESTASLVVHLMNMGIRQLFGCEAKLGKLSNSTNLWIDGMIQRSAFSIDEKGAQCAVVTAASLGSDNISLPTAEVRVDRPFILLITEKSAGLILFTAAIEQL